MAYFTIHELLFYGTYYVDCLETTRNDKHALKDFRSWTSYHYIEMLSVLEKIAGETRDMVNRSRKKRNEVVHERKQVDRQEAYDCLDMARKILRNRIETPDNPFFQI